MDISLKKWEDLNSGRRSGGLVENEIIACLNNVEPDMGEGEA